MVFKKVEFFNNLSFSEKSAQMLCIDKRGVTGHFSDYFTSSLNLRHSCTSPVLCWSLGSISIAKAWEKKVLGCHKFCLSIASIGWLSTGLNHTCLAKSALKQYFHRKKMSQCTLCEQKERIPTRIAWDMAERVPRLLRANGPPLKSDTTFPKIGQNIKFLFSTSFQTKKPVWR